MPRRLGPDSIPFPSRPVWSRAGWSGLRLVSVWSRSFVWRCESLCGVCECREAELRAESPAGRAPVVAIVAQSAPVTAPLLAAQLITRLHSGPQKLHYTTM